MYLTAHAHRASCRRKPLALSAHPERETPPFARPECAYCWIIRWGYSARVVYSRFCKQCGASVWQEGRTTDAPDAFKPPASNETVEDVAHSAESDILLVATLNSEVMPMTLVVRSFTRIGDGWLVVGRKEVAQKCSHIDDARPARQKCPRRDFQHGIHSRVSRADILVNWELPTWLTLPDRHLGFDAQLDDNGILLAAALQSGSVSLFRVDANGVPKLLSNALSSGARLPLFYGDTLLVGEAAYGSDKFIDFNGIVSFLFRETACSASANSSSKASTRL